MAFDAALGDTQQTSVYIPFKESDENDIESYSLFPERDLPSGYELRLAAYNTAWSKCFQRVQKLIRALHAPIVDRVAELVNKAYTNALPGLPYPELPVIQVTVFGASSSIFDEISTRLEGEEDQGLFDTAGTHVVTHLFPQDCSTLASAMKTLVNGFVTQTEVELGSVKRKPASSLSTVDINLLQMWFDELYKSRDDCPTHPVVILHDFERFDPLVVQDLFEIFSLATPRLPLVFILSMTSPPTPSYIHATYPRSTLARLQVRSCSFSTSQDVLQDILLKTFFDVKFDPALVLGPAAIDLLVDFFGRHSPSLDGLVSILQLVHMKHFEEPLTVFLSEESLTSRDLADPDSVAFLDCVLARLQSSSLVLDHSDGWLAEDVSDLRMLIRNTRAAFQKQMKLLRISFRLFLLVQNFTVSLGHKSEKTLSELMCAVLRGRLGTTYRYLCTLVEKLQADQLDAFLTEAHDFFNQVPPDVRQEEEEIISQIRTARSIYNRPSNSPRHVSEIAETTGSWLVEYFERRFISPEELPLWDVWYTGSTPFPSELLNPSLRASIFSGLLHPQDYGTVPPANNATDIDGEVALEDMPDTSILFQRYLESGKMINVFDWFESFTVVLETQRRNARRAERAVREALTLARTSNRRKGKQRQVEQEQSDPEESEEEWRLEVQARFMRALHELDYIGLIKHTGRKADHVMRTVFDVPG